MLMVLFTGAMLVLVCVGGGGPGAVTVKTVVPEVEPRAAVIVLLPAATPVARPALVIVAAAVFELDHVGAAQVPLEPSE